MKILNGINVLGKSTFDVRPTVNSDEVVLKTDLEDIYTKADVDEKISVVDEEAKAVASSLVSLAVTVQQNKTELEKVDTELEEKIEANAKAISDEATQRAGETNALTQSVVSLSTNLYTETSNREKADTNLQDQITTIKEVVESLDLGVKYRIVSSKEEMTEKGYIYLLPHEDSGYSEWMLVEDESGADVLEEIGDTRIDLTDYYTQEQVNEKLDAIVAGEHADLENYYTKSEIDNTLADYAKDDVVVKSITVAQTLTLLPNDGVVNIPKAENTDTGFGVVRLATGWDDTGVVAVMSASSILEKIGEATAEVEAKIPTDYVSNEVLADTLKGYVEVSTLNDYATKDEVSATVDEAKSELEKSITAEETARKEADSDLQTTIEGISSSLANYATTEDLSSTKSELETSISEVKATADKNTEDIASIQSDYLTKDSAANTYATIESLSEVDSKVDKNADDIKALQDAGYLTEAKAEETYAKITDVAETYLSKETAAETYATITALTGVEDSIEAETSARESAISSVESELASTKSDLETSISAVDTKADKNAEDIASIQSAGYITSDALEPYAKSADIEETYATKEALTTETSARESADTALQSSIDEVKTSLSNYATAESVSELSETVDTNTAGIATNKEAIEALQSSLSEYYTIESADEKFATISSLSSVQTELQGEVDRLDEEIKSLDLGLDFKIVSSKEEMTSDKLIYLLPKDNGGYSEWLVVEGTPEEIGDTDIDLTDYYTKGETYSQTELDQKLSEIVAGEEADLANYYTKGEIDNTLGDYAKTSDVDTAISEAKTDLQSSIDAVDSKATQNTEDIAAIQSAGYITESALTDYAKTADVEATYATKNELSEVEAKIPDVSGFATSEELTAETTRATQAEADLKTAIENIDLSDYAKTDDLTAETERATAREDEIEAKIPDVSSFATTEALTAETNRATEAEAYLQEQITEIESGGVDLTNYYTKSETYSKTEVDEKVTELTGSIETNTTNIATNTANIEALQSSLSEYAKTADVDTKLEGYATTQSVSELSETVDTNTANITKNAEAISTLQESLSTDYYDKDYIDGKVDTIEKEIAALDLGIKYKVVESEEDMTDEGYIYLLPKTSGQGYTEWIVIDKDGTKVKEEIGDTDIDLTDYYTKSEVDNTVSTINTSIEETSETATEALATANTISSTAVTSIIRDGVSGALYPSAGAITLPRAQNCGTGFGLVRLATDTTDTGVYAVPTMSMVSMNYVTQSTDQTISGRKRFYNGLCSVGGDFHVENASGSQTFTMDDCGGYYKGYLSYNGYQVATKNDIPDVSGYATKSDLDNYVDLTSEQTISGSKKFTGRYFDVCATDGGSITVRTTCLMNFYTPDDNNRPTWNGKKLAITDDIPTDYVTQEEHTKLASEVYSCIATTKSEIESDVSSTYATKSEIPTDYVNTTNCQNVPVRKNFSSGLDITGSGLSVNTCSTFNGYTRFNGGNDFYVNCFRIAACGIATYYGNEIATKNDIPDVSGYATKSDLCGYVDTTSSQTISGSKTFSNGLTVQSDFNAACFRVAGCGIAYYRGKEVDLDSYVDLSSEQTISGIKRFTGSGFNVCTPNGGSVSMRTTCMMNFYTPDDNNRPTWNSKSLATVNDIPDVSGYATTADLDTVKADVSTNTASLNGMKLWNGTEEEYDALTNKDASTLYIITE